VVARLIAHQVLHVYDDAFITYRYGRNLVTGNGFVYNVGEHVLGTTTPAFGLLVALIHLLGLPVPSTVVVLNILLDLAILGLTAYAVAPTEGFTPCYLFGSLFAISPIMSRVCVGGMEMDLFLFVSLAAILLYHKGWRKSAIALAAFSYFLRPEGVMLAGILVVTEFISGRRNRAVGMAAIALVVVIPPLLAIYGYYGQFVSQSVIAKTSLSKPTLYEFFKALIVPDPLMVVILPFALWGFWLASRRPGFVKTVMIWGGTYILAYAIARPVVWSWYGEPVFYTILLLGSIAVFDLASRYAPAVSRRWLPRAYAIGSILAVVIWASTMFKQGPSDVTTHVYQPLQKWCSSHFDRTTTIAAYDIGVLGYYSDAKIYDLAGLVSPETLQDGSDSKVIEHHDPDYVYLFMTQKTATEMSEPSMAQRYHPIIRFSKDGYTDLSLKKETFGNRWVADYILFKKVAPQTALNR
jgi:hypothetical protein